jgi:flavin reductase (DIM6/NTAB) family NADH-FMN oxidoreductase RutF
LDYHVTSHCIAFAPTTAHLPRRLRVTLTEWSGRWRRASLWPSTAGIGTVRVLSPKGTDVFRAQLTTAVGISPCLVAPRTPRRLFTSVTPIPPQGDRAKVQVDNDIDKVRTGNDIDNAKDIEVDKTKEDIESKIGSSEGNNSIGINIDVNKAEDVDINKAKEESEGNTDTREENKDTEVKQGASQEEKKSNFIEIETDKTEDIEIEKVDGENESKIENIEENKDKEVVQENNGNDIEPDKTADIDKAKGTHIEEAKDVNIEEVKDTNSDINKARDKNTDTTENKGKSETRDSNSNNDDIKIGNKKIPRPPVPAAMRNGVREVMRKVPASVAVLTVASFSGNTNRPVPMGVAVSSLTTVSLDPPLISFNIKKPSKTLDAIRQANGRFRAHFLKADRSGARIVELFCNGNHPEAYDKREKFLKLHMPIGNKTEPPQILDDAVQAALSCTVTQGMPVGDHVILVARISGFEPHKGDDAAIAYVDGKYMRMDGKIISGHGAVKVQKDWSAYEYPFIPGKEEQQDYVRRLEDMFKANSGFLDKRPYEIRQALQAKLALPPNHFGINMDLLFATLKEKAGRKSTSEAAYSGDMPIMAEFYGPLSHTQKTQIINRAIKLVKADPRCVTFLSYRKLLGNLGVGNNSNIVPSDIMVPLRKMGLVQPFQPRTGKQTDDSVIFSLEYLEQTEDNIRKYLAKVPYELSERMRFSKILSVVGEPQSAVHHFNRVQDRLRCESAPELYKTPDIDLRGALAPEEARVAIRRVVRDLKLESPVAFRTQLEVRERDRMVQLGIHPLVSGIDMTFILGKIKHIYLSTPQFDDFPAAIEKALDDMFTSSVTRADLEARVQQFVSKHALRAMSWSTPDRLAAMGLREIATIAPDTPDQEPTSDSYKTTAVPSTAPNTKQEPIAGLVLDTFIAKALRQHYGAGTPGEDDAIAKFLRERYGFDVVRNAPVGIRPVENKGSELLDRLEAKMKAEAQEMVQEEIDQVMEEIKSEKARLEQEEKEALEMEEKKKAEQKEAQKVKKVVKKQSGLDALDELERAVKRAEEEERMWKKGKKKQFDLGAPVAPVAPAAPQRTAPAAGEEKENLSGLDALDELESMVHKSEKGKKTEKKWSAHKLPTAGGGGGL